MYILDTDTIIYFFKGNQSITRKLSLLDEKLIATTVINKIELLYGVYNSKRRNANLNTLSNFLDSVKIIELNENAVHHFALEKSRLTKAGSTIADFDLLIASICLSKNLPLVSNNIKHFDRVKGLKLENWYEQ